MVYKELQQKNLPIPPTQAISSSGSSNRNPSHLPRSIIRSSSHKHHTYNYIHHSSSPPFPQTLDIHDLKHMIKQLCEQMSTMPNPLTTVLTKKK
jgi:hypothetical protein